MDNLERKIDELVLGFWRLLDWQVSPQQCLTFLEQAIEAGIKHTDHAISTANMAVSVSLVKHWH